MKTSEAVELARRMGVANPVQFVCGGEPDAKPEKRTANKWEQEFSQVLENQKAAGLILWYQFEAMRFRLADGATYKPDFMAMTANGELLAYEVKGRWMEAARVRIKVAADRHPIAFIAARKRLVRDGGGWEFEHFTAGRDRIIRLRGGAK